MVHDGSRVSSAYDVVPKDSEMSEFLFLVEAFRLIVLSKSQPSPAEAAEVRRRICTARIKVSFDIFVTVFFVVVISNL